MSITGRKSAWIVGALGLAAGLYAVFSYAARPVDRQPLALMTSLPIYWGEGGDMADLIAGDVETPYVRQVIEKHYRINMLDTIAQQDGGDGSAPEVDPLQGVERLFIVQPRGLGPADNAALDEWVRGGGKLLLALDPLLTNTYAVPISDPRHPNASALIPPVMHRWGITMQFDERQSFEPRQIQMDGIELPVVMAGELLPFGEEGEEGRGDCSIAPGGVLARCVIGAGKVTLLADAAIFEQVATEGVGEEAILALLDSAFD